MNRHIKNKISTPSYFIKRLKDNSFNTFRIFNNYCDSDPRRWTIMIDPGDGSVFVTCYENRSFKDDIMFEFNDGGRLFPKNYSLKTNSIEVVVAKLLEAGIKQLPNNTYD
jgi:hypothetical protein